MRTFIRRLLSLMMILFYALLAIGIAWFVSENSERVAIDLLALPYEVSLSKGLLAVFSFILGVWAGLIAFFMSALKKNWRIRELEKKCDAQSQEIEGLKLEAVLKEDPVLTIADAR